MHSTNAAAQQSHKPNVALGAVFCAVLNTILWMLVIGWLYSGTSTVVLVGLSVVVFFVSVVGCCLLNAIDRNPAALADEDAFSVSTTAQSKIGRH